MFVDWSNLHLLANVVVQTHNTVILHPDPPSVDLHVTTDIDAGASMLVRPGGATGPDPKDEEISPVPSNGQPREVLIHTCHSFPPSAEKFIELPPPAVTPPSMTHRRCTSRIDTILPAYPGTRFSTSSAIESEAYSAKGTPPSHSSIYISNTIIFPPLDCTPCYAKFELCPLEFAYQNEIRFPVDEFISLWKSQPIDITPHLIPYQQCEPLNIVQPEAEFAGIPWRLVIDPTHTHLLPEFRRGSIINIMGSNHEQGKYMVECCQLKRDGIAYLKVVFREGDQRVCPVWDPFRPAFILAVPIEHNHAPFPGNFNSSTPDARPRYSKRYRPEYINEVDEEEHTSGIWGYFSCLRPFSL